MKLVEFYRGEIPNNEGVWFTDIMNYTHGQLEGDHAWVQWVFPNKEPSMFNVESPLITDDEIILFQNDPDLKEKTYAAIGLALDFWGMEFRVVQSTELQVWRVMWKDDIPQWIEEFNHNFLRMTRFLTSLRYLGHEDLSQAVFDNLMTCRDKFKDTTHKYWYEAANGELL